MIETVRLYLVAPARLAAGSLKGLVADLAGAGVDLIQLREKDMEAGDVLRNAEPVLAACKAAGVDFLVNDRPDIARVLGAGVHVGQNDLSPGVARELVGGGVVGLSTHAPDEIDRALTDEAIDYFAVGPVFATPTKPGRPAAGLELVRYAARQETSIPWFAIGGIDATNLDEVLAAGATRIVVVRAVTEAKDPVAVAADLKQRLLRAL